jgi:pimeloyl-ACP methyl ester carboxylesterase
MPALAAGLFRREIVGIWLAGLIVAGCAAPVGSSPASQGSEGPSPTASSASQDPASVVLQADVDVGGRTIHISCLGTAPAGTPTVVLVSGMGAGADAWNPVFYPIAALTRVCAYDRAGLGSSQPAGEPQTTADQVKDLHAALARTKIGAPYVLGGHSLGAWNITLYVSAYPDEVGGLAFIDPRGPGVSGKWLAALPPASSAEPASVAANRDELTTGETDPSLNPEGMDLRTSEGQIIKVLTADGLLFGDRPVIVLGAGRTKESWADLPAEVRTAFDKIWLDEQKALVAESSRGTFTPVPDSGHDLADEDPDAIVSAIQTVITQLHD